MMQYWLKFLELLKKTNHGVRIGTTNQRGRISNANRATVHYEAS